MNIEHQITTLIAKNKKDHGTNYICVLLIALVRLPLVVVVVSISVSILFVFLEIPFCLVPCRLHDVSCNTTDLLPQSDCAMTIGAVYHNSIRGSIEFDIMDMALQTKQKNAFQCNKQQDWTPKLNRYEYMYSIPFVYGLRSIVYLYYPYNCCFNYFYIFVPPAYRLYLQTQL